MQRYPDAPKPKFVHIVKKRTAGAFNAHTLCGRMVNWYFTSDDEAKVTCTRCLAESLAASSVSAVGGR